MTRRILLLLLLTIGATNAYSDLKPDIIDCNAQKAARNVAMKATVGVSGGCDAEKVAKKSKENAADNVKDKVNIDDDRDKGLKNRDDKPGLLKKNDD